MMRGRCSSDVKKLFGQDRPAAAKNKIKMIKHIDIFSIYWYYDMAVRECWNWQTGKTKDLVGECSCGFKSHLPHDKSEGSGEDFVKGESLL